MGNDVEVGVRGDVNVDLTNIINNCSEENFEKVLEKLDSDGVIDPSQVSDKFALIQALQLQEGAAGAISQADKESILERVKAGTYLD